MRSLALLLVTLALPACFPFLPQPPPPAQGGPGEPPPEGSEGPAGPAGPAAPKTGGAQPGKPAGGPAQPPPPSSVSVNIRSKCGKTVKVFYGQKPKFGSGTQSSVSSNSVSSHSFRPGDMMWTTDDKENGLSSVTVGASTREIEIGADCTSISAR